MHSSEISKLWNRVQETIDKRLNFLETSKNSDKADIVVADSKYEIHIKYIWSV